MLSKHNETTAHYIARYRKIYQTLQPTYCPALKGVVHFNSRGFNHLIYKNGHRRSLAVIKNRLPLIKLASTVIKNCPQITRVTILNETYRGKTVIANYFALIHLINQKPPIQIKVIVKKRGNLGQLFFLSIMKQKTPKKGANCRKIAS